MPVGGLARAQVVERGVASLGDVGARPAGDEALHSPRRRLRVRRAVEGKRPAAVAMLRTAQVGASARERLPAITGCGERLERGAARVGLALGAGLEAPAAVAVLGSPQPLRGTAQRGARRPDRAQGEDSERGQVDLTLEAAVVAAPAVQLGDEVASGERAWADPCSVEGEDRALEVSGRANGRCRRAHEAHRVSSASAHVERVAPVRLQPEHRPAGDRDARLAPRSRRQAAVRVLCALEIAARGGVARRCDRRGDRAGEDEREQDPGGAGRPERARRSRGRILAPLELEPGPEAGQDADERRSGGEREGGVAERVGDVEGDPAGRERQVALERLLAAIGDHHGEVE